MTQEMQLNICDLPEHKICKLPECKGNPIPHAWDTCPNKRFCKHCNVGGHRSEDCTKNVCQWCKLPGHTVLQCLRVPCQGCNHYGHTALYCPFYKLVSRTDWYGQPLDGSENENEYNQSPLATPSISPINGPIDDDQTQEPMPPLSLVDDDQTQQQVLSSFDSFDDGHTQQVVTPSPTPTPSTPPSTKMMLKSSNRYMHNPYMWKPIC